MSDIDRDALVLLANQCTLKASLVADNANPNDPNASLAAKNWSAAALAAGQAYMTIARNGNR